MSDAPVGSLRHVLAFAAIVEAATGIALLLLPALVMRLLFGTEGGGTTLAVGRVCGIALLALGLACWPTRRALQFASGPARAMLVYNTAIALYLSWLGIANPPAGLLLWPVVVLHAAVAALLVHGARREP